MEITTRIVTWSCALALVGLPDRISAQTQLSAVARFENTQMGSGHLGVRQNRAGFALGVGARSGGTSLRVTASHIPQGDVEPGFTILMAEYEPKFVFKGGPGIGVRLSAGMHHMDVRNRHEIIAGCQDGCMFEAPGYAQGWSTIAGLSAVASVPLIGTFDVIAGYGLHRLVAGKNDGDTFALFSLGLEYRTR